MDENLVTGPVVTERFEDVGFGRQRPLPRLEQLQRDVVEVFAAVAVDLVVMNDGGRVVVVEETGFVVELQKHVVVAVLLLVVVVVAAAVVVVAAAAAAAVDLLVEQQPLVVPPVVVLEYIDDVVIKLRLFEFEVKHYARNHPKQKMIIIVIG